MIALRRRAIWVLLPAVWSLGAAGKTYTSAAPAESGCKVYDVTPIIERIDANHDGKMTHQEWTAAGAPEASFQSFDSAHRGYVTADQFAAGTPPPGIDAEHNCRLTVGDMQLIEKRGMGKPPPPQ